MQIRNLGPIKELKIDLNKMNLFIGENGMGKTAVAYAIYCFVYWFNETFKSKMFSLEDVYTFIDVDNKLHYLDTKEVEDGIVEQAVRNFNELDYSFFDGFFNHSGLYTDKSKIIVDRNDVKSLIAAPLNTTIRWGYYWDFDEPADIPSNTQSVNSTDNNRNNIGINKVDDGKRIEIEYIPADGVTKDNISYQRDRLNNDSLSLINKCLENIVFNRYKDNILPIYIPAERIGINVFGKYLKDKRADRSKDAYGSSIGEVKIDNKHSKRYSVPIESYITFSNTDLNRLNKKSEELDDSELIRKLIPGEFKYDDLEDEIKYVLPDNNKKEIYFEATSSSLKSIFGVYLFLKSDSKDSWLFLDEPEMNLHPKNQVVVTKLMYKMMKRNIKMIISTHSDYFTKELINCVLKDKLNGQKNNEVNVYEFKDGTATKINNIFNIDEPVNNFDDTTREINNEYYDIVDELENRGCK